MVKPDHLPLVHQGLDEVVLGAPAWRTTVQIEAGAGGKFCMNIVFTIASLQGDGAQRVVTNMANYWAAKGWNLVILTYDDGSEPPFYRLHPSVKHCPLSLARSSGNVVSALANNIGRVLTLRRTISRFSPHCVISFIDANNVVTLISTIGTRVPVIISERIYPPLMPVSTAWKMLRRLAYPLANALVVQTEGVKEYFSGAVRSKTFVIPNAVEMDALRTDRPSMELPPGLNVVAMGRLDPQKRFDLLMRAFAIVRDKQECSLTIVGEGALRPELEALAKELGVQESVFLPGRLRDPWATLRNADIFVLSSAFEGFPNTLVEAMACGMAVISFDCPTGPREMIDHGINGLLVPCLDVDALAEAMLNLITDDPVRDSLGRRATEVIERFSPLRIMGMWEDVILGSQ